MSDRPVPEGVDLLGELLTELDHVPGSLAEHESALQAETSASNT